MLESVLLKLSDINHVMNIEQKTAQHLSRDVMFVASDKMTQIKHFFCGKVEASFCILTLD